MRSQNWQCAGAGVFVMLTRSVEWMTTVRRPAVHPRCQLSRDPERIAWRRDECRRRPWDLAAGEPPVGVAGDLKPVGARLGCTTRRCRAARRGAELGELEVRH